MEIFSNMPAYVQALIWLSVVSTLIFLSPYLIGNPMLALIKYQSNNKKKNSYNEEE